MSKNKLKKKMNRPEETGRNITKDLMFMSIVSGKEKRGQK